MSVLNQISCAIVHRRNVDALLAKVLDILQLQEKRDWRNR